jgi:hypothetical protein
MWYLIFDLEISLLHTLHASAMFIISRAGLLEETSGRYVERSCERSRNAETIAVIMFLAISACPPQRYQDDDAVHAYRNGRSGKSNQATPLGVAENFGDRVDPLWE